MSLPSLVGLLNALIVFTISQDEGHGLAANGKINGEPWRIRQDCDHVLSEASSHLQYHRCVLLDQRVRLGETPGDSWHKRFFNEKVIQLARSGARKVCGIVSVHYTSIHGLGPAGLFKLLWSHLPVSSTNERSAKGSKDRGNLAEELLVAVASPFSSMQVSRAHRDASTGYAMPRSHSKSLLGRHRYVVSHPTLLQGNSPGRGNSNPSREASSLGGD